MLDVSLYDQHDLENKIIIWRKYNDYPRSFRVTDQFIDATEMLISEYDLYAIHYADGFYKVDTDYPCLFIVKELY